MTGVASVHPELLLGPNPFLEPLPPPLQYQAIPVALTRRPLAITDIWSLRPNQRESLLEISEKHFVATSEVIEIAASVQILLRRSLVMLNATNKAERIRVNRVAMLNDIEQLQSIPKIDGAGMLVEGITGTGKSAVIKRMLEIIVPDQVVDHGHSAACEFYQMRQCYYLHVDQPSNGTRGGLLKRILLELDSLLGTSYISQHKRTTNLDTLLVVVSQLLTLHRVAVLVIDEKQEGNFANQAWSIEFVLFYMMLMNLGVSVILLGNPLAFYHLKGFSQVMRRFSTGGLHSLRPATESCRWWHKSFTPGARLFNLVEQWQLDDAWRNHFELTHSAGLPGLFMLMHREVMRTALRRGGEVACVTQADFMTTLRSPRYVEAARIARSIGSLNSADLMEFTDIPPLGNKSAATVTSTADNATNLSSIDSTGSPLTVDRLTRMVTNFKARQTREINKIQQGVELVKTLSPEDARMLGVTDGLMQSMQATLTGKAPTTTRKK